MSSFRVRKCALFLVLSVAIGGVNASEQPVKSGPEQVVAPKRGQAPLLSRPDSGELEAMPAARTDADDPVVCVQPPQSRPLWAAAAEDGGANPEIDQIRRVTIRPYVIRRSDGTGGMDERVIPHLMKDLNYGFRNVGFVFEIEPTIRYIDNDDHYEDIETFDEDREILNPRREDGVINFFFVPTYHGNTGPGGTLIGPPWTPTLERGIFFVYHNTGTPKNIVTPAHEMGHMFLLAHPYETVWGVQCTSNVNCRNSGDRVCDTPASPLLASHNTLATGIYFGTEPPPCTDDPPYDPHTKNYMEAGWEAGHILRDEFTPGQIERMLSLGVRQQEDLFEPRQRSFITDCDGNGVDDIVEILRGITPDVNRDMVPDVCQTFPDPGDLLVCGMTNDLHVRPRYFDGDTGEYRGDIWNGMSWAHQMRLGPDGLVYMPCVQRVSRFDLSTGRSAQFIIDGSNDGPGLTFTDLLFDANDDILALDWTTSAILKYSGSTGELIGLFTNLAPVISAPRFMEYGPDGHIYIASNGVRGNTIQKVDAVTGQRLGTFVGAGAGGLTSGTGLVFHEGILYVSDGAANAVRMYDAKNGAPLGDFVTPNDGGLNNPFSLRFGPDGNLYVASRNSNSVKWYDGQTGTYLGDFVQPGDGGGGGFGGLVSPAGLLFVP